MGGSIAAGGGGSDCGDHCVASAHTHTCACVSLSFSGVSAWTSEEADDQHSPIEGEV